MGCVSVTDPDSIDVIKLHDGAARATLGAAEGRPLRDDPEQLAQIRTKVEGYLYALGSGQVPEVAGRLVEIWLTVPNEPRTPDARALVVDLHVACTRAGHGFCLVVQRPGAALARFLGLTDDEHRPFDPAVERELPVPVLRLQADDEQDAEAAAQVPGLSEHLERAEQQVRSGQRIRSWLRGG